MGGMCSSPAAVQVQPDLTAANSGADVLRTLFYPPIKHVSESNPWLPLLTPHQLVEINSAFAKFDRDGDGHIEPKEISRVMRNLGCPQSDEQIKDLIRSVDEDGNGKIEFDEFIAVVASRMFNTADEDSELEQAFGLMEDPSSPGHVRVEAVYEILGNMGSSRLEKPQLDNLLAMMPRDAEGRYSIADFKKLPCWQMVLPGNAGAPASREQRTGAATSSSG